MSKDQNTDPLNCPCDRHVHPPALDIPAGLSRLPRQLATFPEFRNAMLAAIRKKYPLYNWKARREDDFGVMLLEMWAYVCDVLTFYDQVIAQEAYVRTAQERASLSKLIQLLGYLPRPAVAATVFLAAIADGRRPVWLPEGLAFRSGAFNGEPPQVFELDAGTTIHPFTNKWSVSAPRSATLQKAHPAEFHLLPKRAIEAGMILFLLHTQHLAKSQGLVVEEVTLETGIDQVNYSRITFQPATRLSQGTLLSQLRLYFPGQKAGLWTIDNTDRETGAVKPSVYTEGTGSVLTLNKTYEQFRAGDYVLISRAGEYRPFRIGKVRQTSREPNPTTSARINGFTYDIPSASVPVTEIVLDTSLNNSNRKAPANSTGDWDDTHRDELVVHFDMQNAADIVNLPKTTLSSADDLILREKLETAVDTGTLRDFFLEDVNLDSVRIQGSLDAEDNAIHLNQEQGWAPALSLPVTAYGNLIPASRGETVRGEILGTGDAAIANQSFPLQKKPLTYFPSPQTESGVVNTLEVYVDGIHWEEVTHFFSAAPDDEVYIVRQDEEGNTQITFGDGIRGRRLPTGSRVTADYRFGAGAASPPAGSVNQIATPVEGLQSIKNPVAARGGADAESAENLRTNAPASALLLGRAVSILDMEAVALSIPGIRRARAEWRWDGLRQRPVVMLWYIGEPDLHAQVSARLRNLSDPNTPFHVVRATPVTVNLSVTLQLDPRYLEQQVLDEVRNRLITLPEGILRPENQQIGFPFYRSRLFQAVLAVAGTQAVTAVFWNGGLFRGFARSPGAGKYFDFEKGTLTLTPNDTEL